MRAGVRVTASLALALTVALPATVSAVENTGIGKPEAVSGHVAVRAIDRKREESYRMRSGRDSQPIDYRHYYGERRGAGELRREAQGLRHGGGFYGRGSFVFVGDPAPSAPAAPVSDSRAETDEFDNLVVHHASGYKQIIVGGAMVLRRAGVEAADLFKPAAEAEPDYSDSPSVIYFDGTERASVNGVNVVRPPVVDDRTVAAYGCNASSVIAIDRKSIVVIRRGQPPATCR